MKIDYTVSAVDPIKLTMHFCGWSKTCYFQFFFALKDFRLFVSASKELLVCFGAKLRCFQVFLHWIKILACLQLITLIRAISHSKNSSFCFGAKFRCFQLFCTGEREVFRLFAANHIQAISRSRERLCCFEKKRKGFTCLKLITLF